MRRVSIQAIIARVLLAATGGLLLAVHPVLLVFIARPAAPLVPICQIQSTGFQSPYTGKTVRTHGVVYADLDDSAKRGFFLQAEGCDGDPASSDGLFVYLAARLDLVQAGDWVEVTGVVQEYYGMTELRADSSQVNRVNQSHPLPAPVDLAPPFSTEATAEYFERLEGMLVGLQDATVTGPTDPDGQTWVVRADLGLERVFQDDPRGTGEVICVDDGGLYALNPEAKVGDGLRGLKGALEYSGGLYRLQLITLPVLLPSTPSIAPSLPSPVLFTVATLNLKDLFDTLDDPATEDTVLSAAEYQRRLQKRALLIQHGLGKPEIIAVQEAENGAVLQALASRPEIDIDYKIVWVDGPDERGIDVALMVRSDRVRVSDNTVRQGCTRRVDGFGPDGNRDVNNPQNRLTCDTDGDGVLDGNRLFSRPPLAVHLQICWPTCGETIRTIDLWVIANHWKSKVEDGEVREYTLPRRLEEAQFVAGMVNELSTLPGVNLILLGDLNDFPRSQPLNSLYETGLRDLWEGVEKGGQYSYIYHGVSQVLDYILVKLTLPLAVNSLTPVHLNADFPAVYERVEGVPYRSSDHDPLLAGFEWRDQLIFLPVVSLK